MEPNYLTYYPGTVLKRIRMGKNIRIPDLCDNLISTSYYSKIENNQSMPSLTIFLALIYRVNVSVTEFFYLSRDYHLSEKENFGNFLATIEYQESKEIQKFLKLTNRQYKYTGDPLYLIYHETALFFIHEVEVPTTVIDYLNDLDHWYLHDIILFSLICNQFSDQYLDIRCDSLNRQLKKYVDFPMANNILPMIFYRLAIRMAQTEFEISEYHCQNFMEILKNMKMLDSRMIYLFISDLLEYLKDSEKDNLILTQYLDGLFLMNMEPLKNNMSQHLRGLNII